MAALSALENPEQYRDAFRAAEPRGQNAARDRKLALRFTNRNIRLSHYHGASSPEFARFALESFYVGRTLAFLERLGLLTVPRTRARSTLFHSIRASSVLDVLRFALEAQGANIVTSCDIVEVKHKARGYEALSATGRHTLATS